MEMFDVRETRWFEFFPLLTGRASMFSPDLEGGEGMMNMFLASMLAVEKQDSAACAETYTNRANPCVSVFITCPCSLAISRKNARH